MFSQEQIAHWVKYWSFAEAVPSLPAKFKELGFTVLGPEDDTLSHVVHGYLKDGVVFFVKREIAEFYRSRQLHATVAPTYDDFMDDLHMNVSTNPFYASIEYEDDVVIAFNVGQHAVRVTRDNIKDPAILTAYKAFIDYYMTAPDKLRVFTPQYLYFDPVSGMIRIFDVSSLWYMAPDETDHPAVFPCIFEYRHVQAYVFLPENNLPQPVQLALHLIRTDAGKMGMRTKVEYL